MENILRQLKSEFKSQIEVNGEIGFIELSKKMNWKLNDLKRAFSDATNADEVPFIFIVDLAKALEIDLNDFINFFGRRKFMRKALNVLSSNGDVYYFCERTNILFASNHNLASITPDNDDYDQKIMDQFEFGEVDYENIRCVGMDLDEVMELLDYNDLQAWSNESNYEIKLLEKEFNNEVIHYAELVF